MLVTRHLFCQHANQARKPCFSFAKRLLELQHQTRINGILTGRPPMDVTGRLRIGILHLLGKLFNQRNR